MAPKGRGNNKPTKVAPSLTPGFHSLEEVVGFLYGSFHFLDQGIYLSFNGIDFTLQAADCACIEIVFQVQRLVFKYVEDRFDTRLGGAHSSNHLLVTILCGTEVLGALAAQGRAGILVELDGPF